MRADRLFRKLAALCVLLVSLANASSSAEEPARLPALANYRLESGQSSEGISLHAIDNDSDLVLDGSIRSVAISQNGTIAVMSSSSQLHSEQGVISIYTRDGNLMGRYQYSVYGKRGHDLLFFVDGNYLCYYVCHHTKSTLTEKSILVLSLDGSGIIEGYTIPDAGLLNQYGVETVGNAPFLIVDARSDISIAKLEPARLTVHNSRSNEDCVIYDFERAYSERDREAGVRAIRFTVCVIMIICIVIISFEVYDSKHVK